MTPAEIAQVLADRAEILARILFPGGRRQGRDWRVGSLAGEPGGSLRITLAGERRGRWHEYADGTGGDMLDLVAAVYCGGGAGDEVGACVARDRMASPHHPIVEPGARYWHPARKHRSGHIGPTLVGLVTDIAEAERQLNCTQLHTTWITADGSGRAVSAGQSAMLERSRHHTKSIDKHALVGYCRNAS